MFPTRKNWIRKGLEYLYQLFHVLPKETTCEMKALLQVWKFTFNNDFMMNRELNLSVTRNDFGHVLIFWQVTLFLRVSYWGQVVEMNFSSINFERFAENCFFPCQMSHVQWRCIAHDILPHWDILSRVEN